MQQNPTAAIFHDARLTFGVVHLNSGISKAHNSKTAAKAQGNFARCSLAIEILGEGESS
jgi:hypothetical protein